MARQRRTPRNSSGQFAPAEDASKSPELAPSSIDSVLRTAHAGRSGSGSGSARGTPRFDDTPIPIDLTGSSSARKRRATQVVDLESDEDLAQFEEPAGRTRDGISSTRPWPAEPPIVSDSISNGNGHKVIRSLIVADETIVFLDKTAAEVFGGLTSSFQTHPRHQATNATDHDSTFSSTTSVDADMSRRTSSGASGSFTTVLRSFQSPGSGSASGTSKFNDSPIPIDLTGSSSGRKR
ncbi:hypothetical protein F25303_7900 [Fusarium sp. NRRL 25303]|nr:hypothetical protein F25303_7900 [Fusarium sp. NRRL 25303]